ncbi:MAG: extracellular solute-binding protein [Oscillospiraceae bacterium]|jgi:ABC-type glycerol-3-phosphate transport system substrate-binding protein|nr:extracellular solute-binding protein [Oscillospiraceae bacterium]
MKKYIVFAVAAAMILLTSCKGVQPENSNTTDSGTPNSTQHWSQTETELPIDPMKAAYPKLAGETLYWFEGNADNSAALMLSMPLNGGEPMPIADFEAYLVMGFTALDNGTGVVLIADENMNASLAEIDLTTGERIISAALTASDDAVIALVNLTQDKAAAIVQSKSGDLLLKPLDEKLKPGGSIAKMPQGFKTNGLCVDGKLLGVLQDELVAIDTEFGNQTSILTWMDNDLNRDAVQILRYSQSEILLFSAAIGYTGDTAKLITLTPSSELDQTEKIILTFGSRSISADVRAVIAEFNRTDPDYRIEIVDYLPMVNPTDEDRQTAISKINVDIITGNMPDIMQLGGGYPTDKYFDMGIFADLGSFLDSDEGIELLPAIKNLWTKNGVLFKVSPGFSIWTAVGNSDIIGNTPTWNLAQVKTIMEQHPGYDLFQGNTDTGYMVLAYYLTFNIASFYEINSGTLSFSSEEFRSALAFASSFPTNKNPELFIPYKGVGDENFLMYPLELREFNTISMLNSFFDAKMVYKGFPTGGLSGSFVIATDPFVMNANCAHKEGAWRFIRRFLLKEYQASTTEGCFPTNLNYFNEKLSEAMKAPDSSIIPHVYVDISNAANYEDPNGYIWESEGEKPILFVTAIDSHGTVVSEAPVFPLTQEQADAFTALVNSLDREYISDDVLQSIVIEEAASLLEGQKSIDDVCKIIQNRAEIYINEKK